MEKTEVTKEYRISGDEYMRLQMSLFPHRTWHWFFMAFGLFVMLCFLNLQVAMATVMLASALFSLLVLRYYWLNINQPRHKRYFFETQVSLCDDGVEQSFDDGSTQLHKWQSIKAMWCRQQYTLIFFISTPFLYIPVDAFLSVQMRNDFEKTILSFKYSTLKTNISKRK